METGGVDYLYSADPVLQIAAHEDIIPLDELYRICDTLVRLPLSAQPF